MPKRPSRPKPAANRRTPKSKLKMKTYAYIVNIEPAEEGGYVVHVPALPGCFTQGETWNEALANAQEAIEGYLESLSLHGESIPTEPFPVHQMEAVVQVKLPVPA
jgi:antitoxin HicB